MGAGQIFNFILKCHCTDDFSRQVARYFPATAKVVGTRQVKNLSCTQVDGVNSDLWDFTLVAWAWIDNKKVSYFEALITKEKFTVIELNITKLLYQGKKTLQDIKLNDLK